MSRVLIPESADYLRNPTVTGMSVFGRLRPGSSVERATAAAALAFARRYFGTSDGLRRRFAYRGVKE